MNIWQNDQLDKASGLRQTWNLKHTWSKRNPVILEHGAKTAGTNAFELTVVRYFGPTQLGCFIYIRFFQQTQGSAAIRTIYPCAVNFDQHSNGRSARKGDIQIKSHQQLLMPKSEKKHMISSGREAHHAFTCIAVILSKRVLCWWVV